MFKKTLLTLFSFFSVLLFLTACDKEKTFENTTELTNQSTADEVLDAKELEKYKPYKMGFVFNGFIGDKGWSAVHNESRRALERNLGLRTEFIGNATTEEELEDGINKLINDGCNIIATCSVSYMGKTMEAAEKHPDIHFFNCAGTGTMENLSTFFGRKYQANYLCGIAAGMRTKTNKIGFVAPMFYPESTRLIDSFVLGIKSVNKDAEVYVKYTGTWFDPPREKSNAIELINDGCDVIAQHQNSRNCQAAVQQARDGGKEVWCIGDNIPNLFDAPDTYLTAPVFNFYPYYKAEIDKIIDGTWESSEYWGGLEDKIISIDEPSKNCAEGTKEVIEREYERIVYGQNKIFDGPIYDIHGNLKVKEGEYLSDEELRTLDWYVEGVRLIKD